jgi:integrase
VYPAASSPGTTKNNEGREVFMTDALHHLLTACVQGKQPQDAVFTRPNGIPVRSLRDAWERACCKAGVGQFTCVDCKASSLVAGACPKCKGDRMKYAGLIFHDLRRTAARNLRRAGIAETVIMKIGGWRTRSVFERYAIVSVATWWTRCKCFKDVSSKTSLVTLLVTLKAPTPLPFRPPME